MSAYKNPSRREFLKGSATLAAGIGLAGSLSIARSAHAAGSGQRKIALIGCGGRGTGATFDHLTASEELKDDVKIIAVADAFADNAKRAADKHFEEVSQGCRYSGRADLRRIRRLSEGDRLRRGHGHHGHFARFPPHPLQGRRRGREKHLHGEAVLYRRPRLPHAAGSQQDRRCEEPQGWRGFPAPPHPELCRDRQADPRRHDRRSPAPPRTTGTAAGSGSAIASRK